MKMDLETLAKIVEERVPTARPTCIPEANQIVITFTNRPNIEMALLTPYFQSLLVRGHLGTEDVFDIVNSIVPIAQNEY